MYRNRKSTNRIRCVNGQIYYSKSANDETSECPDKKINENCDSECNPCKACPPGPRGPRGFRGIPGVPGGIVNFADFFALMPPDNAATVGVGTDVSFPQDGPNSGGAIARISPTAFNLSNIGTYQVLFQVSVTEPGQLILTLNGADLAYTVVGRATGTSQIVGIALVTTTSVNSILTVRNPAGNSTALTITPFAGGTRPVSAHLVITQIA
ncbi:hypothetical protein CSC2_21680 [Clostridium zeae]|uniref:Collagen-like protein n=1 Tax=Clostridium zeae TaxID=2759022 RepID=A0ABQ1E9Z8_9CLOT|nr:collagen-like protein [Clostridium zeae]GFZ31642.1 hypothetical protein CSC2_21680 [Clostridium zeae]